MYVLLLYIIQLSYAERRVFFPFIHIYMGKSSQHEILIVPHCTYIVWPAVFHVGYSSKYMRPSISRWYIVEYLNSLKQNALQHFYSFSCSCWRLRGNLFFTWFFLKQIFDFEPFMTIRVRVIVDASQYSNCHPVCVGYICAYVDG